ncbi:MAG: hypothetical protein RQ899_07570 [Pseudomonadales bacterium]|nr:hypothetical protein [Pseudomonadales bacterium]
MAANEILNATKSQLKKTRNVMLSLEYHLELEKSSAPVKTESAQLLSQVQLAYMKLRTAELQEIRKKLEENEAGLTTGIDVLKAKLEDLENVKQTLAAISGLLKIIGRVVALV